MTVAVLVSLLSILYLLPTGVAIGRKRSNTVAIFIVNLFFGWTLIGWVIALVWAVSVDPIKPVAVVQ